MSESTFTRPAPVQTVETRPFWEAARRGEFLFGVCRACGETHYYPRARCPYCLSDQVTWKPASGRGSIYSFSVVRRGNPLYVSAYVLLEEGVAVYTNIVQCDPDSLAIGQPVLLDFEKSGDGQPVPVFRPAS